MGSQDEQSGYEDGGQPSPFPVAHEQDCLPNAEKGQAQAQLAKITSSSDVQEATLKALYDVTSAMAAVEFAGSGLIVNQYGLDHGNAQANVSALSWAKRTNQV